MSNHDNSNDRRIIEAQMPLAKISAHSAREKSIRHGHLSTLHIWWARRPLAACRAAIFAALVPQPEDAKEAQRLQNFIGDLANWDNSIDNPSAVSGKEAHLFISEARDHIRRAFPDRAPRVLDPFSGGGAIPLEALRLGCETYAYDLNPVAHIIQLATLVYPQKYANRSGPYGQAPGATLAGDVRKWGQWVLQQAHAEIGELYPKDPDGSTVIAYLWARTIPCPNTACAVPVPLIRQTWLANKPKKYVAYKIETEGPGSIPRFRIIHASTAKELGFDPSTGTSLGGIATCPSCGTPLGEVYIKSEAVAGRLGELPIAVVTMRPEKLGRQYREVISTDLKTFELSATHLSKIYEDYDPLSGDLPPIPDEILELNSRYAVPPLYGLDEFGKLFNTRQLVSLISFTRYINKAISVINSSTLDLEYTTAITTYLAIALDRLADRSSVLSRWHNKRETLENVFSRQAIPMLWDYAELNPFSDSTGNWNGALDWITKYIEHGASSSDQPAEVLRGDAALLPFKDGYFDAVITDPPYYDNVPYSDLSDFFYVWLRRTIGSLYPTVLGTPLTPKQQEITQDPSKKKSKVDFERMISFAFSESARVLRDDGICVVVYAHKAISAWETLIGSLLNAGLAVDGSWPFSTEMANRLRGMDSAALASSIFLVCRKRKVDAGVGLAGDVRQAITVNVRHRLDEFWAAGLRGADFFISAIGPATAAFSRYDKVMTMAGVEVTVSTLLEWVQQTVADYALSRVFGQAAQEQGEGKAGLGSVDDQTRFYVLWRWTYDGTAGGAPVAVASEIDEQPVEVDEPVDDDERKPGKSAAKKIPFGDALLMATALGADIGQLIHKFHILEGSNSVRLMDVKERAEKVADFGEVRTDGSRPPLIDILHRSELLWAAGLHDDLAEYLDDMLPGDREALRRVAQALIDLLPRGDVEKQRLEGFLYSGVAQDSGNDGGGSRRSNTVVQSGLGDEFGGDRVIRPKRK
jgi:putative DNA methylase